MPIKKPTKTKSPPILSKSCRRLTDYPAFGMWADREDMKDVEAWLRKIRTPRYLRNGGSLFSAPQKRRARKGKS